MKRSKIGLIASGFAVAAMALAGCGGGSKDVVEEAASGDVAAEEELSEEEAAEDGEKETVEGDLYVALVSKGFQHQFWQAVKKGADEAGEEFGVKVSFEGPEKETEVEKQIQMLESVLAKHPNAIGFAALDSQAAIPLLQQADGEGIPIIAFDSGVESDIPLTTVSTDNHAAAAEAAKQMAEQINHEGQVGVVVHDQTSATGVGRRDGFLDYMEENEPNIEIVDVQYGDGDHAKSADITKAMISAYPEIAGIYGANEGSAVGVVQGAKEAGVEPGSIILIGFDSGTAQMDAIRDGLMYGAVTQNPVGIGYETVKAAIAAINGEELPETIDPGFYFYTKDNIDDDEIAAVLYE